jgi:hypothetical protein
MGATSEARTAYPSGASEIVSSETEIYTPYAGAAGMLLHINGKFTMGKLKSSVLYVQLYR